MEKKKKYFLPYSQLSYSLVYRLAIRIKTKQVV